MEFCIDPARAGHPDSGISEVDHVGVISERFRGRPAARRLAKALRLYEERGLVVPSRTAAGWRAYGPDEMARAAEIVALRALGLSLAEMTRMLGGDPRQLEPALAAHLAALEGRIRELGDTIDKLRSLRAELAHDDAPAAGALASWCPGVPGYEAVATCLTSPDVRARTRGVIAWRPTTT